MTTITDDPAALDAPPVPGDDRVALLEEQLRRHSVRRAGWTLFIFVFSAIALLASIIGVGFAMRAIDESKDNLAGGGAPAPGGTPTDVELSEFSISPATIEATSGGGLRVTNTGAVTHDLHVEGTDIASPMIGPGGSATLDLSALEPGEYSVYCMVAGHREAGMEATLRVSGTAGGRPPTAARALLPVDP